MGADLYIKPITEKAKAKYEPLFDAAVKERNLRNRELEKWVAVVKARESIGVSIPSLDMDLQAAKERVKVLNGQIQVAQKEVERCYEGMYPPAGYYRDSYNGTSVLWRLELSWWKDIPSGKQTPETLKSFLAKVKSRKLPSLTLEELKEQHCTVNAENSVKTWARFYRNKKRRLVRFLTRAYNYSMAGGEVYFSL